MSIRPQLSATEVEVRLLSVCPDAFILYTILPRIWWSLYIMDAGGLFLHYNQVIALLPQEGLSHT